MAVNTKCHPSAVISLPYRVIPSGDVIAAWSISELVREDCLHWHYFGFSSFKLEIGSGQTKLGLDRSTRIWNGESREEKKLPSVAMGIKTLLTHSKLGAKIEFSECQILMSEFLSNSA